MKLAAFAVDLPRQVSNLNSIAATPQVINSVVFRVHWLSSDNTQNVFPLGASLTMHLMFLPALNVWVSSWSQFCVSKLIYANLLPLSSPSPFLSRSLQRVCIQFAAWPSAATAAQLLPWSLDVADVFFASVGNVKENSLRIDHWPITALAHAKVSATNSGTPAPTILSRGLRMENREFDGMPRQVVCSYVTDGGWLIKCVQCEDSHMELWARHNSNSTVALICIESEKTLRYR